MSLTWDSPKGWAVQQIPSSLPPLYSGDRLVVYGLMKPSEKEIQGGQTVVRLQGTLTKGIKVEHAIKFPTPTAAIATDTVFDPNSSVILHGLAAKSFIQVKQDELSEDSDEEFEEAIVSVSKSANVISKYTSIVAVDKENHEPVSGPLMKQMVSAFASLYSSPLRKPTRHKELECARFKVLPNSFQLAGLCEDISSTLTNSPSSPFLSLISLQQASGAWDLTDELLALCKVSKDAVITGCPKEIAVDTSKGKLLWATALALVLLRGKFLDQEDEWEMIAEKGKKWMNKNLPVALNCESMLQSATMVIDV